MSGVGQEFMESTRYRAMGPSDQEKGVPQPPLELPVPEGALKLIDLPAPRDLALGRASLREVMDARRSLRKYSEQPLSLAEISYLLWATQGVRDVVKAERTTRSVPSAGARHAFETLLLVNRVDGLESGLYRFLAMSHRLALLPASEDVTARVAEAALGQKMIARSAATFVWVAVAERMSWRYGERGYRYLHLDAGHVAQNLYLAAESIGAGACAVGAFADEEMNALFGLDGENQFVIYLAPVGKRILPTSPA
ncbi:MAG: SagB/ThcOx family dehydrogenase [Candidatus Bipolaricaulis sp.]|nr:SagB/ThcOx family dehydrogenase [Candidatus Bipolaricaulis sp.]MDD5646523.1 SagB/ThcOx family dehydrogenase [Candidatus Bipolaricaulis sp.]